MNAQDPRSTPRRDDNEMNERQEESGQPMGDTMAMRGDASSVSGQAPPGPGEDWVGRRMGKYAVTGKLGVGGMGVVLKAHDTSIERDVAIKVLPPELSTDEVALRRFLAEAKSAGRLSHPHTVTIYEIAQHDSIHYLAMELVDGGSAEDLLRERGAFSVAAATRMAIEACSGLQAAHEAGLVHRDVKPANLLLTRGGAVKVSDFGLAKHASNEALHMTKSGQVIGTPYYMSPEQCAAREVDPRSDIYSLGATYYSLLTGKSPFADSGSVVQVMYAHCNAERPNPSSVRPDIPAACGQIIQRAMATDPEQRYQSTTEMRADLEAVLAAISGGGILLPSQSGAYAAHAGGVRAVATSSPNPNRRLWLAAAGTAVILGIVGSAAFWRSGGRFESPDGASRGEGEAGENPDGSSPAIPAPSGDPIKIGILHSLSGTMAVSESPVVDAALLAVEELNRDGGVLGRPVEAIVADGRSDPATFAQQAERLINTEKVCTVFGCWTSACRKTVVPVFEEFDHLLVYPVQYEGLEESPNVIYTGAAPNQQIIPAVKWAYAFDNKRRFFLVGSDYVFPRVAHEIIKDQLQELGAALVGEEFVPLGGTDVEPIIRAIQESQPDVILNSINGDSNAAFFAALRAAGIRPTQIPTISFSIGEAELSNMHVADMAGDYAAWNYFQSIESDENQEFVAAFRGKYGPERNVTDPMEAAYFGIKLWAQAVNDAGSIETPAIRRAMRNQRMRSPGGEVRIDPSTQHTFKTPRIGQIQTNGHFEIVWTGAKPEPPRPYPASRTAEQWRAFLHDLYTGWGDQWAAPAAP